MCEVMEASPFAAAPSSSATAPSDAEREKVGREKVGCENTENRLGGFMVPPQLLVGAGHERSCSDPRAGQVNIMRG